MPDELLTKQQVAHVLGVSPRTVDRWQACGDLPQPTRVGNRRNSLADTHGYKRWSLAEIQAYIESQKLRPMGRS